MCNPLWHAKCNGGRQLPSAKLAGVMTSAPDFIRKQAVVESLNCIALWRRDSVLPFSLVCQAFGSHP